MSGTTSTRIAGVRLACFSESLKVHEDDGGAAKVLRVGEPKRDGLMRDIAAGADSYC